MHWLVFDNKNGMDPFRWSRQYSFDKSIATKATISLEDWTSAYQWAKSRKQVRSKKLRDFKQYFCPSGKKDSLPGADVRRAKVRSWTTFEDFRKKAFAVWVVQMKNDEWDDASCSCPRFLKVDKCRHIIGMAIRLQLVHAPSPSQTDSSRAKAQAGPAEGSNSSSFS